MARIIRRARALARQRVPQRLSKTAWMARNGRRFIKNNLKTKPEDFATPASVSVNMLADFDHLDPQGC